MPSLAASLARPSLLLAVALAACKAAPPSPSPPPYTAVADVKTLMSGIVEPAAELYWDAVGEVEDSAGVHATAPATGEQWTAVRNGALIVAESGNLLMLAGRARDSSEWMTLSRGMIDAGRKAMLAAAAHDSKAVFDAGAELYESCVACHERYAINPANAVAPANPAPPATAAPTKPE